MAGNGPINTNPCFCSDEDVAIRLRGDYWSLGTASDQLAYGTDGVFAANNPWILTSTSVNFEAQGVVAQCVIQLSKGTPVSGPQAFLGSGKWYAVDAANGNSLTLRMLNQQLGVGQPPSPLTGLTNVTFNCITYQSLIEDSSWDIKDRFGIDDAISARSSMWMYQGVEDDFRGERAATVLQVAWKAYGQETRTEKGDFQRKAAETKREFQDVIERLQVRWGPLGNSAEPTSATSGKLSR